MWINPILLLFKTAESAKMESEKSEISAKICTLHRIQDQSGCNEVERGSDLISYNLNNFYV